MMHNLRNKLTRYLLNIYNPEILSKLKRIKFFSTLSLSEKKLLQDEKLSDLLIYSYINVPYYTKVLQKAKVVNSKLEVNLKNFKNIPLLTKSILNEKRDELKSLNVENIYFRENSTGGSTGEPTRFIQDKYYIEWNIANKLFFKNRSNVKLGDFEIRFWGKNRDLLFQGKFFIFLRNIIYNRKDINLYNLSEKNLKDYLNIFLKKKPLWVEGYVEALVEFSKYALENNYKLYPPKGVVSTAGTLYPENKKIIEKAFGCKVYNRYGSREVGDIAFGSGKLHVSYWNNKVEIIENNSNKATTSGKIIVTNLNNYVMPLIRYEIGDIGQKGSNEFELEDVKGREISLFKKKNGSLIDASYFTLPLSSEQWIKKYQIVQKKYDLIEYYIVSNDSKSTLSEIKEKNIVLHAKKKMGKSLEVKFFYVNRIRYLKSGKYLFTKCEVEENE